MTAVPNSNDPFGGTERAITPVSQTRLAIQDLVEGALRYSLWGTLAWHDIRERYRRSVLGPFWLTISMGTLVGALGLLYAALLKIDISEFFPHLASGFVIWGLISGVINDSCRSFIASEANITSIRLPYSLYVYRLIWRNLIIFFHNLVIFVVVAIIFSINPGWTGLLAIPGLAIICINALWTGILLGMICIRYRDVSQIVTSILQLAFFLTPIIWMPSRISQRALLLELNPFYHTLEVIRAPLLGQVPAASSWYVLLGITAAGYALMFVVFQRKRKRLAYWV